MTELRHKHIGLAAIIASIFIPLSQIFAPIYSNFKLETQKEKLELMKLFMEFQEAPADKQSRFLANMELFYPELYLNYRSKIAENAKSFNVLQEISNPIDTTTKRKDIHVNNKIISARTYEMAGFICLKQGDLRKAKRNFENAESSYPTLHNVHEISKIVLHSDTLDKYYNTTLEQKRSILKEIYKRLLNQYSWGMPSDIHNHLKKFSYQ